MLEFDDSASHPATGDLVVQERQDDATPVSWWIKTIASWVLLSAAVGLLGALVVVPRLTGSTVYTVLTGSMEPGYPPGTTIVVRPTPGDELKAGDVITFQPESGNPAVVTHRIVSIFLDDQGRRRFITKGDANKVQDETRLIEEQIRGRLLYSVPFVGRVTSLVSGSLRTIGLFVAAGGLGAYALWMWVSSARDRRSRRTETDDAVVATESIPAHCHACGQPLVAAVPSRLVPPEPRPPRYDDSHPPRASADAFSDAEITRPLPVTKP